MDRENSFSRKPSAYYKRDILRLAISIAIPLIAGVVGSIFTSQSVSTWYQTIERPSFSRYSTTTNSDNKHYNYRGNT